MAKDLDERQLGGTWNVACKSGGSRQKDLPHVRKLEMYQRGSIGMKGLMSHPASHAHVVLGLAAEQKHEPVSQFMS